MCFMADRRRRGCWRRWAAGTPSRAGCAGMARRDGSRSPARRRTILRGAWSIGRKRGGGHAHPAQGGPRHRHPVAGGEERQGAGVLRLQRQGRLRLLVGRAAVALGARPLTRGQVLDHEVGARGLGERQGALPVDAAQGDGGGPAQHGPVVLQVEGARERLQGRLVLVLGHDRPPQVLQLAGAGQQRHGALGDQQRVRPALLAVRLPGLGQQGGAGGRGHRRRGPRRGHRHDRSGGLGRVPPHQRHEQRAHDHHDDRHPGQHERPLHPGPARLRPQVHVRLGQRRGEGAREGLKGRGVHRRRRRARGRQRAGEQRGERPRRRRADLAAGEQRRDRPRRRRRWLLAPGQDRTRGGRQLRDRTRGGRRLRDRTRRGRLRARRRLDARRRRRTRSRPVAVGAGAGVTERGAGVAGAAAATGGSTLAGGGRIGRGAVAGASGSVGHHRQAEGHRARPGGERGRGPTASAATFSGDSARAVEATKLASRAERLPAVCDTFFWASRAQALTGEGETSRRAGGLRRSTKLKVRTSFTARR